MSKKLILLLIVIMVMTIGMSACSFGFSFIRDSIEHVQGGDNADPIDPSNPDDNNNPPAPDPPVVDKEYDAVVQPDSLQNTDSEFYFASAADKKQHQYRFLEESAAVEPYNLSVTTDDGLYSVLAKNPKSSVSGKWLRPTFTDTTSVAYELYQKMLNILDNIISNDMSEFERVLAINDYLVYSTAYDKSLYDRYLAGDKTINMNIDPQFNLKGVFINKAAVCRGLSRAFVALCSIEGINACSVGGFNGETGHEWSKVYIHKPEYRDCTTAHSENCDETHAACSQVTCDKPEHRAWYVVDTTSNNAIIMDGNTIINETIHHAFFLIGDQNPVLASYRQDANSPVYSSYPVAENDYTADTASPEYGFYEYVPAGSASRLVDNSDKLVAVYNYAKSGKYLTVEFMWLAEKPFLEDKTTVGEALGKSGFSSAKASLFSTYVVCNYLVL